jgi:hypothetical protein
MAAETLVRAGRQRDDRGGEAERGAQVPDGGKSGLNITKDEPPEAFKKAYGAAEDWLVADARRLRTARGGGLGRGVWASRFSPAARAGLSRGDEGLPAAAGMAQADRGGAAAGLALGRLGRDGLGVRDAGGPGRASPEVTVLALGGASWRRLGSDGAWAAALAERGVDLAPFRPANMGFAWTGRRTWRRIWASP